MEILESTHQERGQKSKKGLLLNGNETSGGGRRLISRGQGW